MDFKETAFDYLSCDSYASFSTTETKWIRKIKSLQQSHPDDIQIIRETEDGILVHIPKSWMKISPPRKMTLTDEQRLAAGERMKNARKNKKGANQ